jgi:hypothetical protein
MRTLLTRRAGQPGTKKLMRRYGADLLCVRYRYDEESQLRLKTIELVVERIEWTSRRKVDGRDPVHVRLDERENLLRRAVLFAGGRWNETTETWVLSRESAIALGLAARTMSSIVLTIYPWIGRVRSIWGSNAPPRRASQNPGCTGGSKQRNLSKSWTDANVRRT